MAAPTIQVLVGFQTTTGFGNPFQLDSATYGLLNTGTLGGLAYADLTSIVQSVNITRGRNRQLDQFNAGTATISFYNASRVLDPLNTASIYYPYVLPRCPVIINANGVPIYTGLITDWNLDYDMANKDIMYASCSDNFTVLANQQLNAHTTTAELSSTRVSTVFGILRDRIPGRYVNRYRFIYFGRYGRLGKFLYNSRHKPPELSATDHDFGAGLSVYVC